VGRLNTPDDQVGADYVVGIQNARYLVPTIEHVDRHVLVLTARLRKWIAEDKFPDLVETLTVDRDRLLDRRGYLMAMAVQAS
jgi:hypothetical protein